METVKRSWSLRIGDFARAVFWILVVGVLVLWTAAWLAVPPLLKSQAQQRLSDLLGRAARG